MANKKAIITAGLLVLLLFVSTASAATLNVGPHAKYKTIQSAVNAAREGDIIKVAPGIYRETVVVKGVDIYGVNYPRVNGFEFSGGGNIIGFKIMKDGIDSDYAGGGLIRNNYFYNCGVSLAGGVASGSTIVNNQFSKGGISLYDCGDSIVIKGNTISNAKIGLNLYGLMGDPQVTKNTFKNCKYAIYFDGDWGDLYPGRLPTFSGNKYIKNKVNIGWNKNPVLGKV